VSDLLVTAGESVVTQIPVGALPACSADEVLMAAAALGDVQAYSALVERHLPSIYRLCVRMIDDRHEAEDLAQESFARLWQSAPNWRPVGGGLPAWLHRVASNLCFDRMRARREIPTDDVPELADQSPDAIQLIQASQLEGLLDACLGRLPAHQRAALVLTYYEGYSNALTAQIMDMKLKAFESLLLRARRRMSDELRLVGVYGEDLEVLA
jgi:RNA polymerase sigma-70 factor (ECF subfamily)